MLMLGGMTRTCARRKTLLGALLDYATGSLRC
jgi:hypothetical protein